VTPCVHVAPLSFGLGDLVVSLPPIQTLIARAEDEPDGERDEVWLIARSESQRLLAERIAGLAGCVDDETFDRSTAQVVIDLRDHPLQSQHWWGSRAAEAALGTHSVNDLLAVIAADAGVAADFSHPVALTAWPRPELSNAVLFVAETDGPMKRWPPARWEQLARAIEPRGLTPLLVTRDGTAHGDLARTGINALAAPTPGDAVDVLTAAHAVIGVDTGLTHIAAQQSTPTVTLCRSHDVYFRAWPHTRAVRGEPCDAVCRDVEEAGAYHQRVDLTGFDWQPRGCPVAGRCIDDITVGAVTDALDEVVGT